jgi:hypothetical protein
MQEILGTELEVGQEYYVMKQEKNPLNSVDGQWETRVKYSGTYTGRIFYKFLNFIVIQQFSGNNLLPGKQHEPISYNTPSRQFENFRTLFYKKTDTPKNQEMRDNRQQREALTQMFGKLPMHQYYDNDGQSQFARGPDGKSYFPPGGGGRRKRTLRRASKSKKRRARTNKRKKTRRTKRY